MVDYIGHDVRVASGLSGLCILGSHCLRLEVALVHHTPYNVFHMVVQAGAVRR